MSREVHVRFCESRGVRFPPATHLVVLVHGTRGDVEALHEDITHVLQPLGLRLSAAKTRIVHMSDGFDFPAGWSRESLTRLSMAASLSAYASEQTTRRESPSCIAICRSDCSHSLAW